jgi:predicted nicotinamide N-methyase
VTDQYFSEQPTSPSDPVSFRLEIGDVALDLTTDSGVFARGRLDKGTRVLLEHAPEPERGGDLLDLGCGWGLVGIACAKRFQAQVTGFDADAAVFPYLQLHAQRNGVQIATRHGTFADLTPQELAAFDLIVGADICFWEDLVDPLYQLVRHSVAAGVAEILVADPSRPPFDDLCARCVQQGDAAVLTWTTTTPVADTGRILRVVGRGAAAPRRGPVAPHGGGVPPPC